MTKIVFDNSIHLGQFNIDNNSMRIAAKNSQIMISTKPIREVIGIESFNENSVSDDIIWGLEREPQDTFYKFMDNFHSYKNIDRVPLNIHDAKESIKLAEEYDISISNALTCVLAIRNKADAIHSFYTDFSKKELQDYLQTRGIELNVMDNTTEEMSFKEPNLEDFYQETLKIFKKHDINLLSKF